MTALHEADWHAARAAAGSLCERLGTEQVGVADLDGRVIAQELRALCDLPSHDTSAMDGWAVSGAGPWRVVGDALAGGPLAGALTPGTCVRIATGAVVPPGATAIVRWEDAQADADAGTVTGPTTPGRDIRPRGEECRVGDRVAEEGIEATPALVGFCAATGHDVVPVTRRPRVGLILLGDELQSSGLPQDGRIRDALGPQLPGLLRRSGAVVEASRQVGDHRQDVVAALGAARDTCDLVISTGGTAAGPRDHLHGAIEDLGGRLVVDCVRVKPGHPMLLAHLPAADGRWVPLVGLPGNPHSAVAGFMTLALPVIDALLGRGHPEPTFLPAAEELRSPTGHTRLVAGVVRDGQFVLSPYGGSAMLRGLARSRGFAVVREGITPPGGAVEWLRLP